MPDLLAKVLQTTLKVLVVEDEERFRRFLLEQLAEMNCAPLGASTAMEALEVIAEQCPDVVFLDLNLPGMDGMDFLRRFRRRNRKTPVIILTGVGTLALAQEAIRYHVTEFLTKPCHLGQIETALDRARRQLAEPGARSTENECPTPIPREDPHTPVSGSMAEIERHAILEALRRHAGNRTAAAREMGISRRTLYNRIAEYKRAGYL